MTQSIFMARSELKQAKLLLDAAENRALAADGPVTPTRQCMDDKEFDEFARHMLKALAFLTPTGKRGEGLRKILTFSPKQLRRK